MNFVNPLIDGLMLFLGFFMCLPNFHTDVGARV